MGAAFRKIFCLKIYAGKEIFPYYRMKAPFEGKTALAYVEGQRALALTATPRQRKDVEDFLSQFPAGKK